MEEVSQFPKPALKHCPIFVLSSYPSTWRISNPWYSFAKLEVKLFCGIPYIWRNLTVSKNSTPNDLKMNSRKIINLWSGPRNISTAMMYAFAQRSDTQVIDEPLYAHYLSQTGKQHPDTALILQSMENDGNKVVKSLLQGPKSKQILFLKQMTHHLIGLDWSFLRACENILLLRHPKYVINSFSKVYENAVLEDIGIEQQRKVYDYLAKSGKDIFVLEASDLLKNPEKMLRQLCQSLQIPFEKTMLQWQMGARPEDGIWAKHWYAKVHNSEGFKPYKPKEVQLPAHLQGILEQALPHYEYLRQFAIKGLMLRKD